MSDTKETAGKVTKNELGNLLAEKVGTSKSAAQNIVSTLFDEILPAALQSNGKVVIPGFGTFEVKTSKERNGVNPATGAKIVIAAKKHLTFKAGKGIKDLLEYMFCRNANGQDQYVIGTGDKTSIICGKGTLPQVHETT